MIVSAVQAAPIFLDAGRTASKITALIEAAAARGAALVAFPEAFLPGYPVWLAATNGAAFNCPKQKSAYSHYLDAAVESDGPHLRTIAQAARDTGVFAYVGIAERGRTHGRHSVYCSLAAIHPEKGLVGVHRKLMPTYEERLVWSAGDANGLKTHEWRGFRLGGLNCWENWMPLPRQALYELGENVHVAVWPGSAALTTDISRFVALEGRSYVVSASGVLHIDDIPDDFPLKSELRASGVREFCSGGSRIVAPDGLVLDAVADGEEGLAISAIDVATVNRERNNFDPSGHYSRPDALTLRVNFRRLETLEISDSNF
jgi:nitrilase